MQDIIVIYDIWDIILKFIPDLQSCARFAKTCKLFYKLCRNNKNFIINKFIIYDNDNIGRINDLMHYHHIIKTDIRKNIYIMNLVRVLYMIFVKIKPCIKLITLMVNDMV